MPQAPRTGVVAIARRPALDVAAVLADERPAPVVLLEDPRDLGNMGACVRVAAGADAAAVLTTGQQRPLAPRRAARRRRAALRAAGRPARRRCRSADRPLLAIDPEGEALRPASCRPRAVLAFGTERHGLSEELLARADARLSIPMRAGVSSLNLATSVAAVLFSCRLSPRAIASPLASGRSGSTMRNVEKVALSNEEAVEAWNGVLFDRFVQYRHIVTAGLGAHGEEALRAHPPRAGERVLDIGCGFGDTSRQMAALVGPEGSVLGIDAAERFVEIAEDEARAAGAGNVSFVAGDLQVTEFEQTFDYAFPGWGLCSSQTRCRRCATCAKPSFPVDASAWSSGVASWRTSGCIGPRSWSRSSSRSRRSPTSRPAARGPFSMGDADVTSQILLGAGFEQVSLLRCDIPIKIGVDLGEAVEFAMALGPAGEVIRLAGEDAERIRPRIAAALRKALAEFDGPDGVIAPASTWIVTARAPV